MATAKKKTLIQTKTHKELAKFSRGTIGKNTKNEPITSGINEIVINNRLLPSREFVRSERFAIQGSAKALSNLPHAPIIPMIVANPSTFP